MNCLALDGFDLSNTVHKLTVMREKPWLKKYLGKRKFSKWEKSYKKILKTHQEEPWPLGVAIGASLEASYDLYRPTFSVWSFEAGEIRRTWGLSEGCIDVLPEWWCLMESLKDIDGDDSDSDSDNDVDDDDDTFCRLTFSRFARK